jgi:hypothetical protein
MKSIFSWVVMPWSQVKVRRSGGICRLHLHGRRVSQAGNQRKHVERISPNYTENNSEDRPTLAILGFADFN